MKNVKFFSRPVAFWVGFFNLLTCCTVLAGMYWLIRFFSVQTLHPMQTIPENPHIATLVIWSATALRFFWTYFAPAVVLFFILETFLVWLILRSFFKRRLQALAENRSSAPPVRTKADDAKRSADMNRRIFLHLVTVLQKEGRLLDFFSENLMQYDDNQIGAAVRNIHDNCKKALDKYLAPHAVLDQSEGDEISVDEDFDPNALKLVGNVTGQPPFKGIVRHRGWRAMKIDMPTLSGQQDPWIIAPAEIEIR
jgi:Domain of unknown function (DUF2760)